MKPLIVLARIIFVGCLWSIIFTEGIRVIMLENWRFDMFWPLHWVYAWNLWSAGWVIDTPKEWAFVLIIVSFIPLWLTGWIALSMVAWEKIIYKTIMFPINLIRNKSVPIKVQNTKAPVIVKKKSYKEIRPTGRRTPIRDYTENDNSSAPIKAQNPVQSKEPTYYTPSMPTSNSSALKEKVVTARETFNHSLFNLDNEEDDFDLDFGAFEKSDIFNIDDNKSKKKAPQKEKNNKRFIDDSDEDDFHNDFDKKPQRRFDDEDYQPRRKNYDDDEDSRPNRRNEDRNDRKDRRESYNKYDDRKSAYRDNKNRDDDYRSKQNRRDNDDYRPNNKEEKIFKDNNQSSEKQRGNNPIVEVLTQKGYDVVSGITVKNTIIDFLGISEDVICLCLVDKETGDWLADEERFNNEEPLWFSENSHRISPVRKAELAKEALESKLEDAGFDIIIKPFVIVQAGNIINAEDMLEIWEETKVKVTRINRGSPKEIQLFSKTVEEADAKLDREELNRLKKLIKAA